LPLPTLLHHKPATLLVIELEPLHSSDFCGFSIWRIYVPEKSGAALPEQRCTPGAELWGVVLLWSFCRVAPDLQIFAPDVAPRRKAPRVRGK
jgi:hypothetical protein